MWLTLKSNNSLHRPANLLPVLWHFLSNRDHKTSRSHFYDCIYWRHDLNYTVRSNNEKRLHPETHDSYSVIKAVLLLSVGLSVDYLHRVFHCGAVPSYVQTTAWVSESRILKRLNEQATENLHSEKKVLIRTALRMENTLTEKQDLRISWRWVRRCLSSGL
jgi:hypothetical protein